MADGSGFGLGALRGEAPHALRDNAAETVRGILVVVLSYLAFTAGDVAGKWALAAAGVSGVMIGRGLFGALTVAGLAAAEGDWRRLLPVRRGMVALRSLLHGAVSMTWYVAWQRMTLADVYAIAFVMPLVMTLLAIPMLGERLRWRRMVATAVGFGGVLFMVRPGGELWSPALAVLVPGIVGTAVSRIMTRQLSTTETAECLTFWLMVAHVPVGVLLLHHFPPGPALSWAVFAALVVLGLFNGTGHWLMARAYALAPVSALAPYEYTMLIWGGIFGYAAFSEVPAWTTLAGAAVVAAAGLYNLYQERREATWRGS